MQDAQNAESSAAIDFTLANLHNQRDEIEQAEAAYKEAIGKHEKYRRAWSNLAELYYRQGQYEKAVAAFAKVIQLGGGDAISYGLLGDSNQKLGEYIAAETAFRVATMFAPKILDWKLGLAESLLRQGRFADAASMFESLIKLYPDKPRLWLTQGEAYVQLSRPLDAIKNFEMVDRLGGSTQTSLNNLGDLYAYQAMYSSAVDAYVRAIRRDPKKRPRRAIRAARHMSQSGALEDMRALIAHIDQEIGDKLVDEDLKDVLKLKARLAVADGDDDEEARVLEQITKVDPTDGDALILLGKRSKRKGDLATARTFFERAANIEPFEAKANLNLAGIYINEGRLDKALQLLRQAQRLKPSDGLERYIRDVERAAKKRG